ncbi:YczI family protein [Sporosarcina siberiensis]|uniref:YczI family protein n=1 Tax=Sporosarcina siberiensis TaxID=1365606 RepID=A0ABW4SAK6_9BACL
MLKILRIVLVIIGFVLGGYILISSNYEGLPYMMFVIGTMLLVIGIAEIKQNRKKMGIVSIIGSLFVFYVSVEGLLF